MAVPVIEVRCRQPTRNRSRDDNNIFAVADAWLRRYPRRPRLTSKTTTDAYLVPALSDGLRVYMAHARDLVAFFCAPYNAHLVA
jgi:hypothetical protein